MKRIIAIFFLFIFYTINVYAQPTIENVLKVNSSPKPFILDMDFSTDVDDVMALRLANNLHKQGIIEIKAIGLSTSDEDLQNLKAVNGLLNYDGIYNIPLGYSHQYIEDSSPYWDVLDDYYDTYFCYDSVSLYRYIISRSKKPVTICTTGFLNNIADLVKSEPDFISLLSGKELLEKNGTKIFITGGEPNGWSNNLSFYPEAREATDYLIHNIEGLYFIQSNTGGAYSCGTNLQTDYKEDPVAKSLWAFNGCDVGRWAWDPTAVWIASLQDFDLCNMNIESIDVIYDKETGINQFIIDEDGFHYRIYRRHDNLDYYKNIIDQLILPLE